MSFIEQLLFVQPGNRDCLFLKALVVESMNDFSASLKILRELMDKPTKQVADAYERVKNAVEGKTTDVVIRICLPQ